MSTECQIAANRENAQHSTGPRTDDGKSNSSHKNALRHGLTARGLIVLPGQEEKLAALESDFRASLIPTGAVQETLFTRILESAWNLERCRLAEAQLYLNSSDPMIDPLLDDHNDAKYARIRKYARQSESSMHKAMRELGRLQTEAQYRHEIHPLNEEEVTDADKFGQTPHSLSEVCDFQKIIAAVTSCKAAGQGDQRTNSTNFMAMLEHVTAPPVLNNVPAAETSLDREIDQENDTPLAEAA